MELNVEDDIENLFPDLVANLNQDSDSFDSLLSSKNTNFSRSTTCLIDDVQLNQSTSGIESSIPVSTNSLFLSRSNKKSRKSSGKDSQMRRSVNIQSNNKNSPLSSKITLKPIGTDTLDHYKRRTVEDFANTGFSRLSQKSQEDSYPETSSFNNSFNDESCDLSRDRLLKTQSTHSPCISSVQNPSSKLVTKETITKKSETPIFTDGRLKSCMKEKQKDSRISGSSSPLYNISFKNKSSQKKDNGVVLNCNTDPVSPIENNSLQSKFHLVSACSSTPIPASSLSIDSTIPNDYYNMLQTPVGRCRPSQSFMKTPNRGSHLKYSGLAKSYNKTPTIFHLSRYKPENSISLSGVKRLHESMSEKKLVSKRFFANEDISLVKEDDMPCTQPTLEIILRGVVAYVEIRSDNEDRNEGVKAELESLGAKVEKNFTKKVTHCFFRNGRLSTYKRAVDWKVPIVCVLWIVACKAELRQVPLNGYEPHGMDRFKEALALYRPRIRIRRPVTDSKVLVKLRKPTANSVKKVAPTKNPPKPLGPPSQEGRLVQHSPSARADPCKDGAPGAQLCDLANTARPPRLCRRQTRHLREDESRRFHARGGQFSSRK